jgi:hypothetical protein
MTPGDAVVNRVTVNTRNTTTPIFRATIPRGHDRRPGAATDPRTTTNATNQARNRSGQRHQ